MFEIDAPLDYLIESINKDKGCAVFMTKFIIAKQRDDGSFRKIVIGTKVMQNNSVGKNIKIDE